MKHSTLPKNGASEVNIARWRRRAIEASINQLYGAERALKGITHVVKSDSSPGVALPDPTRAHVSRVAIALGSEGSIGMPYGDFGKGFVHVLDESATDVLLGELDTIRDFVAYLREKEHFLQSVDVTCEGGEEDLLAVYLNDSRSFPPNCDLLVVTSGVWEQFQAKPEYKNKKLADKESYAWDRIIEIFCHDALTDNLEFSSSLSAAERSIRTMAREDRFARRILGKSYLEFIKDSHSIRSRKAKSPSGVVYVFLATPHGFPRDVRQAELGNRCFVARGQDPEATTVVGLATEQHNAGKGFSLDLCHMYKPDWTPADQKHMEEMQKDLGYFVSPRVTKAGEDEYPPELGP